MPGQRKLCRDGLADRMRATILFAKSTQFSSFGSIVYTRKGDVVASIKVLAEMIVGCFGRTKPS
jgi:hypothetical protein